MANEQLEAIGMHGQDDNVLRRLKAKPFHGPMRNYCKEHGSYFCPCTGNIKYKKGDPTKKDWDDAKTALLEKQAQKRQAPQ